MFFKNIKFATFLCDFSHQCMDNASVQHVFILQYKRYSYIYFIKIRKSLTAERLELHEKAFSLLKKY